MIKNMVWQEMLAMNVHIVYSFIAFVCARSFCKSLKNANQIYCRKIIVLHPAETLLPLLPYLSNYDFSVRVELPVIQTGQCWITQHNVNIIMILHTYPILDLLDKDRDARLTDMTVNSRYLITTII